MDKVSTPEEVATKLENIVSLLRQKILSVKDFKIEYIHVPADMNADLYSMDRDPHTIVRLTSNLVSK